MDAGDFVPDNVTNNVVRERLNESDVDDRFYAGRVSPDGASAAGR